MNTISISPDTALPGEVVVLTLTLNESELLGASIYFKSNGVFPILDRQSDFTDLVVQTADLAEIGFDRSQDLGGLFKFGEARSIPVITQLTLEVPMQLGSYSLQIDPQSAILYSDLSTSPLLVPYAVVAVVPELCVWASLLLAICCIRFRKFKSI